MVKLFFALQRYYWQIYRALPCSFTQKRGILRCIRNAINCYRQEESSATMTDIRRHFGTPAQIASSCVNADCGDTLIAGFCRRQVFFKRASCTAAFVFALLTLCIAVFGYVQIRESAPKQIYMTPSAFEQIFQQP